MSTEEKNTPVICFEEYKKNKTVKVLTEGEATERAVEEIYVTAARLQIRNELRLHKAMNRSENIEI